MFLHPNCEVVMMEYFVIIFNIEALVAEFIEAIVKFLKKQINTQLEQIYLSFEIKKGIKMFVAVVP
jgi:hypothetical protein